MAFTKRTGNAVQVRQGNNDRLLSTFRGKDAEKRAAEEVRHLHEANNPKPSNRGKSAAKKF